MRVRSLAAAGLLLVLAAAPAASAPAVGKVVIVAIPGLTWEDVASGRAPTVRRLSEEGSIAGMSIRTVGPRTDLASAYATLGAGNRARGRGEENLEFAPTTVAGDGGLVVRGAAQVRADNESLLFGARTGALGKALHDAGLKTAVVGNADGGAIPTDATAREPSRVEVRKFAGLALADPSGLVDSGDGSSDLVIEDETTLNGFRTDSPRLLSAFRRAVSAADVVLVELADTFREGQVAFGTAPFGSLPPAPEEDEVPERDRAIARDDRLLSRVVGLLDLDTDAVFVLGLTGPGPARPEQLTVAVHAGSGSADGGWLTSPTTRRDGLVVLPDVAPGVLSLLCLTPPEEMTGQPLRDVTAAEPADRISTLTGINRTALFHLRWIDDFYLLVVLFQVALYVAAWRRMPVAGAGVVAAAVAFMGLPLATLAVRASGAQETGLVQAAGVLVAALVVSTVAALAGPWRRAAAGPPAFVCGLTALVVSVDLVTGANLQMSSLVGYSPIVAGRFFGIGNLMFAIYGTCSILAVGALASRARWGMASAAAAALVVTILEGAPNFGADFGGVLSMVVGWGVLLLVLAGRRVSVPRVAALGVAGVLVALLAGFLDSLRAPEQQTHLGRFTSRLMEGDFGWVGEMVLRKALANWSLLTSSVLILVLPVAASFLFFILLR
ncbi:MAG: hypothetical protein ACRDI1_12525, partial [Actinomycetota bacterium]